MSWMWTMTGRSPSWSLKCLGRLIQIEYSFSMARWSRTARILLYPEVLVEESVRHRLPYPI